MDVMLTSGVRGSLLSIQAAEAARAQAAARLATGRRVSSPVDDAKNFFESQSLKSRAGALEATLDGIGLAISTIQAATDGLEAGRKMLEQLHQRLLAFDRFLPAPSEHDTSVLARKSLTYETPIAGLDDDANGSGPIPHNQALDIQLVRPDGSVVPGQRARFRLDIVGTVDPDAPGAATPTFYSRTVGELIDDINASALDVTAGLVDGQFTIAPRNANEGVVFSGSTHMLEAFHLHRNAYWGGQSERTLAAKSRIVTTRDDLELDTDLSTLGAGIANNANFRFITASVESGAGYNDERVTYRVDNRRDFGGRTVRDIIGYINDVLPSMTASLEDGRLVIEGPARGVYVDGASSLLAGLGLERGTHWGGTPEAPKRFLGVATGIEPDTDAGGTMNYIDDGNGGRVRFIYGAANDGTTMGDWVDTINAANQNGETTFTAGFADGGRVYLQNEGTNFIPHFGAFTPLRVAGLGLRSNLHPPLPGSPTFMPETSPALSPEQWRAFQSLNDNVEEYDNIIRDARLAGSNLLDGKEVSVALNERGTELRVGDRTGLLSEAIGLSSVELWDIADRPSFDAKLSEFKAAFSAIDAALGEMSTKLAVLSTRRQFNTDMINLHLQGAAALVLADQNEAGASLLAAQTRQQLAHNSLTLTTQAEQSVLRLFR